MATADGGDSREGDGVGGESGDGFGDDTGVGERGLRIGVNIGGGGEDDAVGLEGTFGVGVNACSDSDGVCDCGCKRDCGCERSDDAGVMEGTLHVSVNACGDGGDDAVVVERALWMGRDG